MAYVSTTSDPKVSSIQCFRTPNYIIARIVTKEVYGWDQLQNVSTTNNNLYNRLNGVRNKIKVASWCDRC